MNKCGAEAGVIGAMQEMDEETIAELIGAYHGEGGFEFYAYQYREYAQPFCAIYTAGGLARVYQILGTERSLWSVIGKGMVKRLEVKRVEAFENYNSL
jgi:molybdopterin-guanine dinucleotide biosynthesis protein A